MAVSARKVQNNRDGNGVLTGKPGTVYDVNIKYNAPEGKKAQETGTTEKLENAKENPRKPLIYAGLLLAEAVGFEPTSPCGLPHFECGSL